ncbi:hypothetical protein Dimus_035519 [Dionaea muscipula]
MGEVLFPYQRTFYNEGSPKALGLELALYSLVFSARYGGLDIVDALDCRYGDKCKFLHATSQQPKANMFGFGTQTGTQFQQSNTQQQPNPFGFGVQNTTGSANSGASKQTNLFKPFENKWTRSSSVAAASSPSLQQPSNQSQAANHQCSDPESCKRIIAEDFEHEKPLWKLTCYGHYKYLPCDITGDISYEELRAVAYDDGKRGINLQSIVERERSLLNSKLNEFQSLLLNRYSVRSSPAQFTAGPFPPAPASISSPETQPSGPPSVSSFSQLGASLNMGLNTRQCSVKAPEVLLVCFLSLMSRLWLQCVEFLTYSILYSFALHDYVEHINHTGLLHHRIIVLASSKILTKLHRPLVHLQPTACLFLHLAAKFPHR